MKIFERMLENILNTSGISEDEKQGDNTKTRLMKKRNWNRFARRILLIIMILCLIPVGRAYYLSVKHQSQQEKLADLLSLEKKHFEREPDAESPETPVEIPEGTQQEIPEVQEPVMLSRYSALYEENNDLIGWLSIEGMKIDYPVMQCEDNEYYLHHSFYGEEDKYGCLFVKDIADVDTPGTNFIIYGHNMKDGSMFGDLDFYKKEDFYKEHSVISFDTLYEQRTYEVMAVFTSQVYGQHDDVFKYYNFYEAKTPEEFDAFYESVKELSFYDTGVEAEYGDTFLTLSTCAYHVKDGRLVLVAKRVTE